MVWYDRQLINWTVTDNAVPSCMIRQQMSYQKQMFLHITRILLIIPSSNSFATGNLYKLVIQNKIWPEDILDTFSVQNKIHCASLCNQKFGCIGFGISFAHCTLLKSFRFTDTCEENCDGSEMKVYLLYDFEKTKTEYISTVTPTEESTAVATQVPTTTTTTKVPTTTNSQAPTKSTTRCDPTTISTITKSTTTTTEPTTLITTTTKPTTTTTTTTEPTTTTTTTTEPTTTITTSTETTTTEPTTTTTEEPIPPPPLCGCDSVNGYFNGMKAYTQFYKDGGMTVQCQCMGDGYLFIDNNYNPTSDFVYPPYGTRCSFIGSGLVYLYINYDSSNTKLYNYRITCNQFRDGIVDVDKEIITKTSAPENREVRCDDYQVIFGYQAIEQVDGTFEVRLDCQQLIPR